MITVSFYLKDYATTTGNQVIAKIYDSNDPKANIRTGLKVRVFKECWSNDDQQAIGNRIYNKAEVDKINKALIETKDKINKIVSTLELREEIVTGEKVKSLFESDLDDLKKEVKKENLVNAYIEEFYIPYSEGFHFRSSPHISFKAYQRFEAATKKRKVKEIGIELMKEYSNWLKLKGNKDSTINQRIKKFKRFVKSELKHRTKIDNSYESFSFDFDESEVLRLTLDQFNTLFLINDLPSHLEAVRDWFIIMTTVGGIRMGSAQVLNNDSFNRLENKVTYLEMKKSSKKIDQKSITNPLNMYTIHIMEKRNWQLPNLILGQHFNQHLKEIVMRSDELRNEYFTIDENGKKNVKKYLRDLITSKTARKTFVSFNEDVGISRSVSNAMSNHSTKSHNASDAYRLTEKKYLWERKLEVVERWNLEYYKLFPNAVPTKSKKVLKLANGHELVVIGNTIISGL